MEKYKADIILDSVNPYNGVRLTTFSLRYPRVIHAELMTHKVFSRNASSSRAIPYKKLREQVIDENLYLPPVWGWNQRGMQQKAEPIPPELVPKLDAIVRKMRDAVLACTDELDALGVHKQQVNRYLEPFGFISVVLTATEFSNFFNLRCHPAADIPIQIIADKMLEAYTASQPVARMQHLPYLEKEDYTGDFVADAKRSAARCARVSYLNHEGKRPTLEEDMELYGRLMVDIPKHASPVEHQARVLDPAQGGMRADAFSGNLRGWFQFRKSITFENLTTHDSQALLSRPNRPKERA